ncbi:MAG TPA: hypothetical protein VKI43_07395, partial [Vicinamibacterales bacterium]|nr:hypothetical protein [Vicinamibacterales bacterium]
MADRFAVHEGTRAFDLATGARVTLITGTAGGVSEQMRWQERCASLHALRHRAVAPLVDFGLLGESRRFEAWGCGGVRRARDEGKRLHASATLWLRACGLSTGLLTADAVRQAADGHGVWVPDAGTGYPGEQRIADCGLRIAECGLRIVEQPALPVLAEMFHSHDGARPRVAALWGPRGAGKRVLVGELARIARARGFVPVAARLIGSRQAELWRGRSLFVIADAADERPWSAFLDAALRTAQPHALLLVGEEECRSIGGVALGPLDVDALTAAIYPQASGERVEQMVRRAAERARGWPGRFARTLWPASGEASAIVRAADRARLPRVAEQPAVYDGEEAAGDLFEPAQTPCDWPAPGELAALRRKRDRAIAELARGRHAPGIRQLRQVVGGLARRGAWSDAAGGARALAGSLLKRGRAREAQAVVGDGREYATRAGEEATLVDLAILGGDAWIDMGRLDEADSVLGTALAAARALQDPPRVAAAALALARGSYWRGEFAEADALLASAPDVQAMRVRRGLLASRIAVGQ